MMFAQGKFAHYKKVGVITVDITSLPPDVAIKKWREEMNREPAVQASVATMMPID